MAETEAGTGTQARARARADAGGEGRNIHWEKPSEGCVLGRGGCDAACWLGLREPVLGVVDLPCIDLTWWDDRLERHPRPARQARRAGQKGRHKSDKRTVPTEEGCLGLGGLGLGLVVVGGRIGGHAGHAGQRQVRLAWPFSETCGEEGKKKGAAAR